MKKHLSRILALGLVVSLSFCFGLSTYAETAETPAQRSSEQITGDFDTSKTSAQIVEEMQIGWSLGNTFDAWDGTGLNSETAWGNPKTTEDMLLAVKAMGFRTVRIPVTWGIHTDDAGNIDPLWMARVKEVVDYAYNNDLYVILNSHHDNSVYDIGACLESAEVRAANTQKIADLWTQIANTFKDYDEHLVFETMNEPRTEGSEKEWLGGTKAEYEVLYGLNCAIVEAIRATGGNNAYRHILVPAYAATYLTSVLRSLKLPDDDRVIVSIHAYLPYSFAMDANGPSDFTDKDKKEIDKFFSDLNHIFIKKGIPVMIGEFGATNKDNLEARCAWAEYYVKTARQYGISCGVWDNNIGHETGAECFGLYDRSTGEWVFPELAQTMVNAANEPVENTEKSASNTKLPVFLIGGAVIISAAVGIVILFRKRTVR